MSQSRFKADVARIVVIAIGEMGASHLETMLRQLDDRGLYKGMQVGICSSKAAIRSGDLSSLPEVSNLGVQIRREIESEILQHLATYESVEQVIADSGVDAVIIARETSAHSELVARFVAERINVFVEKPLAFDSESSLAALKGDSVGSVAVGHILPFFSEFGALLRLVLAGTYGSIVSGKMHRMVQFSNSAINDPGSKAKCRSAFFDLFVHDAHLAMAMFGKPTSFKVIDFRTHPDDPTFLSWAAVRLEYVSGYIDVAVGAFEDDSIGFAHGYSVQLEQAKVIFDSSKYDGKAMIDAAILQELELAPSRISDDTSPIAAEHDEFFQQVLDRKGTSDFDLASPLHPHHAVNAVVLADAAERAALTGEVGESITIDWPSMS